MMIRHTSMASIQSDFNEGDKFIYRYRVCSQPINEANSDKMEMHDTGYYLLIFGILNSTTYQTCQI